MTEKKLRREILDGGREAVREMIEENYEAVYRYCYYRLGDRAAAQDAAQEVFLKFLSSLPEYQERGKLRNYLYVIAGNTVKDMFRKKRETAFGEPVKEQYEGMEEQVHVRLALQRLSEEERELVVLRYYQELRLKDIARIVGMPVSNVRYRLKKAERKLEEVLK